MSYCSKCHSQLDKEPNLTEDGWWLRYDCPQCHFAHYVPATQSHYTPTPQPENEEGDPKVYIIAYLICIGIGIASFRIINISIIFHICALVVIATGFIKYPHNIVIKILFWLTIPYIILVAIAAIIFIACANACTGCYNAFMSCG